MPPIRLPCLVLLVTSACGFTTYEELPLEPQSRLEVATQTRAWPAAGPVNLAVARERLFAANPEIRDKLAAHRTAVAAAYPTPWPNPVLMANADFSLGPGVAISKIVPYVSLGLTLPWSGTRGAQDEANLAAAELARVDALATARTLYLELRARWQGLALAQERVAVRARLREATERAAAIVQRMVDVGEAAAGDVFLFELERARAAAATTAAAAELATAEAELGALLDAAHSDLGAHLDVAGLSAPPEVPPSDELRALLIDHHPELLRLRAEYTTADRNLNLQLRMQYPDLTFTPSYRGEISERFKVLSLPFTMPLPLFARNQPGVAQALAAREESFVRFETACSRALAQLEQRARAAQFARTQHERLLREVAPVAQRTAELARRAIAAGTGSALRLLEAERAQQQVAIDVLDAEIASRAAWSALERAVGRPLSALCPQDSDDTPEPIPAQLAPATAAGESR